MIKGDSLGSRRSRSSRSESFTEPLLVRQRSYSTPMGKTAYLALINVVEDVNTTEAKETECSSVDNKDHKDSGGELKHCRVIQDVEGEPKGGAISEGNQVCFTKNENQERKRELINEECNGQDLSSKENNSANIMNRGDASGKSDSTMADHERNTSDDHRNERLDEQTNEEREGDVTERTDGEIIEESNKQVDDTKTQEMVNSAETSDNDEGIVRSPCVQDRIMFFNSN